MTNFKIVIPVRNNLEITKACIDSLVENTHTPFELIIIDDESTEDIKKYLSTELRLKKSTGLLAVERLTYHRFEENAGVSKCWNKGIRLAGVDNMIAILNNDILVDVDWDIPLIKQIEKGASIASPYQISPYHDSDLFARGIPLFCTVPPSKWHDNGYPLLGSCFVCRPHLFTDIGLIDERLKNWSNDSWIVYSCMHNDYKMVYAPESHVIHLYSRTIYNVPPSLLDKDVEIFTQIIKPEKQWK